MNDGERKQRQKRWNINQHAYSQAQMMSRAKGMRIDVENETYSDSHF